MANLSFQDLFCAKFNCPSSQYEERAFNMCLYWHARAFATLARILNPSFFAPDLKFIRYLGESTRMHEALCCVADFQDANFAASFLRKHFRLRVSGRKALALARQAFFDPKTASALEQAVQGSRFS